MSFTTIKENTDICTIHTNKTTKIEINKILNSKKSLAISKVWFGSSVGYWKISRDDEILLVLKGTNTLDFNDNSNWIRNNSEADIIMELCDDECGFLILELKKLN